VITLGDLDMWSFTANTGDSIVLRIGGTNFYPEIDLYGPDGKLLGTAGAYPYADAYLAVTATNSGTFTVVVSSSSLDGSGPYTLHLAKIPGPFVVSPGEAGGMLTNGVSQNGPIYLGDQDLWAFEACKGFPFILTCQKLTGGFTPRIRLYGRTGLLLATVQNASIASLTYSSTNSGSFTALIDSATLNQSGTYQLTAIGIHENAFELCPPLIRGTNLDLSAYGGASNAVFVLFSSTNVTIPVAAWTPILTNQFDAFGAFDYTNSYSPAVPQRFFYLLQK